MFEADYRSMAVVPRWAVMNRHRNQNLAEHSYYVALYSDQIAVAIGWVGDRGLLARAALLHDTAEIWFGDIPGPAKLAMVNKAAMEEIENRRMKKVFGGYVDFPICADTKAIIKAADCLDACLYLVSEQRMGNSYAAREMPGMTHVARKYWEQLGEIGGSLLSGDEAVCMFNDIILAHWKDPDTLQWGETA